MGLITYTNIENATPATPNLWNDRFGKIINEINGNLDSSNIKDGSITQAKVAGDVFTRLYPIGSIYINATDNTNPGTLLGFGTWTAFGAGRVPVGVATSGTFASAGATLGEEQHTLTGDELPSHNHGVNDPGHTHNYNNNVVFLTGSSTVSLYKTGASNATNQATFGNGNVSGSGTGISIQNAGNNQPHNNIQPSVVVYMWQRVG